tara:strand:+ start:9652 stop:10674 length:1023 start_codon:yes stop_codon:yes gene_type:complete
VLGIAAAFCGIFLMGWWELDHAVVQLLSGRIDYSINLIPTTKVHVEARYGVAASFLFLLAAGTAAFAQSWRQMNLSFADNEIFSFTQGKRNARVFIFWAALVLGLTVFVIAQFSSGGLRETLVPDAFNFTLGRCSSHGCVLGEEIPKGISFLQLIDQKIIAANFLSSLVSVFVAVGACCLVIQSMNIPIEDKNVARDTFARLAQRWKNHLYFASLFLVAGIIEMSAWRNWPAAYMISTDPAAAAFQTAANGTVLMHGLIFTITLFAIFMPAATLMNDVYTRVGLEKKEDGTSAISPLSDFRNLLSLKEITKSGLAILAPVISGAAPIFVDFIESIIIGGK